MIERRRWWALAVLCLSVIITGLGNSILNVALPSLARPANAGGLGATEGDLQWIVDASTLVFAGLLLWAGSLGDRFGRYGALTVGLVVFGASSVAGMLATSPGQLIAARAAMGVGGALIMPATLSILTNVFLDPTERGRAIGVWAASAAVGLGLGPVGGGLLLEHCWWGSVLRWSTSRSSPPLSWPAGWSCPHPVPRPGRGRRRWRRRAPGAALVVAAVALAACGGGADRGPSDEGAGSGELSSGREVVHAAGTTDVPADVDRVVALDQPAALNALSLGVEPAVVLAGFQAQPEAEEILASYDIATEPYSVAEPALEAVAAAQPDLVLGSGHPATIAAYDRYSAIAPTVVIPFSADWHDQLSVTAAALDRQDEADALGARIDRRLHDLQDAIADRHLDGTSISVVGSIRGGPFAFPNSGLAGQLLAELGTTRPPAQDVEVDPDQGFVTFSAERLLDHDADTLITVTGAVYDTNETITGTPLYQRLHAVEEDRDYQVAGDIWLGAAPFAAAWILDDLTDILIHQRQPSSASAERWNTLVPADRT
jgi:ABC-type Fe3+-hydroxamate transport system substrate-binding protein